MRPLFFLAALVLSLFNPLINVSAEPIDLLAKWAFFPNGPSYDWAGYDNTTIQSNGTLRLAGMAIQPGNTVVDYDEPNAEWPQNVNRMTLSNVDIEFGNTPKSIDDIVAQNEIDHVHFLKINTQGNVYEVLLGAETLITNAKVDFIQFPYGRFYTASGITFNQVFQHLIARGYLIFRVSNIGLINVTTWRQPLENNRTAFYVAVRNVPSQL